MASCLADNTTGKERKDLARWIFAAMAAHTEMRDLSSSTPATREKISQSIGALITRLLTENCADQTKTAMAKEGSQSLQTAFGSLGQLAMQELMTNQDVNAAISDEVSIFNFGSLEDAQTVSRETSVYNFQTDNPSEAISREWSLFNSESAETREAISREVSLDNEPNGSRPNVSPSLGFPVSSEQAFNNKTK